MLFVSSFFFRFTVGSSILTLDVMADVRTFMSVAVVESKDITSINVHVFNKLCQIVLARLNVTCARNDFPNQVSSSVI